MLIFLFPIHNFKKWIFWVSIQWNGCHHSIFRHMCGIVLSSQSIPFPSAPPGSSCSQEIPPLPLLRTGILLSLHCPPSMISFLVFWPLHTYIMILNVSSAVRENTLFLSFGVWLMLLNIMISSSIHFSANVIFHFSSRLHKIPLGIFFVHSSVAGHLRLVLFPGYKISNKNRCASISSECWHQNP